MNYTDRVAKGAAELDRILPGWERKVDLERLQLADGCNCVLGQLEVDLHTFPDPMISPYCRAIYHIAPYEDLDWSADRGFNLPLLVRKYDGSSGYTALTQAWKRLIRQRLETGDG